MVRDLRALLLALAVSGLGCSSALHVKGVPVRDTSAVGATKTSYKSVMVLPPRGSERGEASELAALEKELLRRSIRVVSSGVTGRVVVEQTESGKGTEGATNLSDLERALVLARKSNAEALLQVSVLSWQSSSRLFAPNANDEMVEVSSDEFATKPAERRLTVKSRELRFEGKLIDVETGEIVASIALARSVADAADTSVTITRAGGALARTEVEIASDGAREKVASSVVSQLAEIIASGPPRAAAPSKPAAATEPTPEPKTEKAAPAKGDAKKKPGTN